MVCVHGFVHVLMHAYAILCRGPAIGGDIPAVLKQRYIDLLLQNSFILRSGNLSAMNAKQERQQYGYMVPGSGTAIASVQRGRTELLNRIRRRKNGELLLSKLKSIKLSKSILGVDWHVKDLIGLGMVHVTQTTVGPLLRAVVDEHQYSTKRKTKRPRNE